MVNNSSGTNTSGNLFQTSLTTNGVLFAGSGGVVNSTASANSSLVATNSSGTVAMRTFSVVTQVFTSSGTYTPTAGMLYCKVRIVGGGGAGGRSEEHTSELQSPVHLV